VALVVSVARAVALVVSVARAVALVVSVAKAVAVKPRELVKEAASALV